MDLEDSDALALRKWVCLLKQIRQRRKSRRRPLPPLEPGARANSMEQERSIAHCGK
jgi:hypothetical protein